jgi:hypothetical protein
MPPPCRDVGRTEIRACALEPGVWNDRRAYRRVHPCRISRAIQLPDALGQGDAERDRTDRGQASLAAARQQTQILQSNCKQATA